MEPVHVIEGTALPIDRSDVDTDQIIPAEYLKRIERSGFGPFLFAEWRKDPDFVLNDSTRSGHYVQLPMSAIPGIVGEPMTIRVEVLEGSRVGAYVVTVDQISSDTVFVQGRPTHLLN